MTLDEIRAALSAPADTLPSSALRAAVPHADTLAPDIYAVAAKFCGGTFLVPRDANLLFFGLHVLAAARHKDLYPCLLELLRADDDDLDLLFDARASTSLAQLMLSVWDGDADALFHKIEHADLLDYGRWALFDVLSRLTFDGRIPRERTEAFLVRFEAERLADLDDIAWWAWEDAVTRLGFIELEPVIRRIWVERPGHHDHPQDAQEKLDRLRHAAANPSDPAQFIADGLIAVDDPADALAWMVRRDIALAALRQPNETGSVVPKKPDALRDLRMSPGEESWLGGLLLSRHVGSEALSLEELEGFLTASVIGPPGTELSQILAIACDVTPDETPEWFGSEQEAFAKTLIEKQLAAIAAQRIRRGPIQPYGIDPHIAKDVRGLLWAAGFELAVVTREADWEAIFVHERTAQPLWSVLDLGPPVDGEEPLDPAVRKEILGELPNLLRLVADYWTDPAAATAKLTPARSTKVGRNDPCPCGSGKKYKKCCSA